MLSHRLFDPITIHHVSQVYQPLLYKSPEPPHGENLARITGPQQKAIRIAQKPKNLHHLKNQAQILQDGSIRSTSTKNREQRQSQRNRRSITSHSNRR